MGIPKQWSFLASWLLIGFVALALLPACGTQQGTIDGQVLGMYAADQQPKILSGASVQVSGSHGDQRPVVTDSSGKFHMTLPYDNYNLLAVSDGFQSREKSVQLDSSQIETVGFVLVAPGVQQPDSPPPLAPQDRQALSNGSAFSGGYGGGGGGSFLNDPWFWFWMFDRPYYFGYPRIPFVTYGGYRGSTQVVIIDHRTDPILSSNQRGYTSYRDPAGPASAGTKPAPVTVSTGSKGVTKPGTGGITNSGARAAPVAPPGGVGSSRSSGSSSSGVQGSNGVSRGLGTGGSTSGLSRPAPVAPPGSSYSRGSSISRGGSKGRR